jgi:hypothetical protein
MRAARAESRKFLGDVMAMRVRLLVSAVVLVGMMGLASCGHYVCGITFGSSTCTPSGGGIGQGGGGGTADAFLYLADAGGVQGFTLNASAGTLTDIANPITGIPNDPNYWTVIAQKQYMYIGYPGIGEIYGFTISATGALTGIAGSPFSAAYLSGSTLGGSQAMITNPAGTLLFVLNPTGNAVYVYSIGTSGALTQAGSAQPLPFEPLNLAVDGLGKYLYVSNTSGGATTEIAAYSIGTGGTLTVVPNSPFVSTGGNLNYALAQMQGDPSGAYMIGTTASITNSDLNLYVLAIQSDGEITPVTNSPFQTKYSPGSIAVQPSPGGTLVYSLSSTNLGVINPIEGYQINLTTGALSAIAGSPFTDVGGAAQFDQSGQFLFVVEDPGAASTTAMDVYDLSSSPTLTTPTASLGWSKGSWAPTDIP